MGGARGRRKHTRRG
uniref:Uncharacterized protein n=1 Tax=Arundo donax TaxID=35708 RepID=A0A0A8YV26_ARUDO